MWKKPWDKLKTALSGPEEYIVTAPPESEEEQEEEEREEVVYCTDSVVLVKQEDLVSIVQISESLRMLKIQAGEAMLRHEAERQQILLLNERLNQQAQQQIQQLRTTYNVEPTVDYTLNFPSEEGGEGSLVRVEPDES